MRENELEQRQMEAAKILAALNKQEAELYSIIDAQQKNKEQMETLYTLSPRRHKTPPTIAIKTYNTLPMFIKIGPSIFALAFALKAFSYNALLSSSKP